MVTPGQLSEAVGRVHVATAEQVPGAAFNVMFDEGHPGVPVVVVQEAMFDTVKVFVLPHEGPDVPLIQPEAIGVPLHLTDQLA